MSSTTSTVVVTGGVAERLAAAQFVVQQAQTQDQRKGGDDQATLWGWWEAATGQILHNPSRGALVRAIGQLLAVPADAPADTRLANAWGLTVGKLQPDMAQAAALRHDGAVQQ